MSWNPPHPSNWPAIGSTVRLNREHADEQAWPEVPEMKVTLVDHNLRSGVVWVYVKAEAVGITDPIPVPMQWLEVKHKEE